MDIYRLIKICGILVILWVIQIVAFSNFQRALRTGPPTFNIVDMEKFCLECKDPRPLVVIAAEKGWDMHKEFTSAQEAAARVKAFQRKKWTNLVIALLGVTATMFTAYRLWESWLGAILIVFFGPAVIAFVARRYASID